MFRSKTHSNREMDGNNRMSVVVCPVWCFCACQASKTCLGGGPYQLRDVICLPERMPVL